MEEEAGPEKERLDWEKKIYQGFGQCVARENLR